MQDKTRSAVEDVGAAAPTEERTDIGKTTDTTTDNTTAANAEKNSERTDTSDPPQEDAQPPTGPSPIFVVIVLILALLLLGMLFALVRVFFVGDRLDGNARDGAPRIVQENGSLHVTFCQAGDCRAAFASALGVQQNSTLTSDDAQNVTCAFYDLTDKPVIESLIRANATVLLFKDNIKPEEQAALTTQGLRTALVPSIGLMHDKFCVVHETDGDVRLITGSMNPTIGDVTRNDNNLLVIESRALASRYEHEAAEFARRESEGYTKNKPQPIVVNITARVADGTTTDSTATEGSTAQREGQSWLVEQRFCPQEDCEGAVVREISAAKSSVRIMLFTFTSDPIRDALLAAVAHNVTIEGVVDKQQSNADGSEYAGLRDAGFDIMVDGNKYLLHHKVVIIDAEVPGKARVITGSFNPTKSANERNDENLLIIWNDELVAEYVTEYERVRAEATS